MRKIPTAFLRDFANDPRYVTREPNPECAWVFAGEGLATRKYDGTCVMLDDEGNWWARREVKLGKPKPHDYWEIETDPTTGKTMGWEPIEQSAFAKFHAEALAGEHGVVDAYPVREAVAGATYELLGPRINGNPEKVTGHMLVRHGYRAGVDGSELRGLVRDYDSLRDWLLGHDAWEGIVWHHEDGRMAKLKVRDFPRE